MRWLEALVISGLVLATIPYASAEVFVVIGSSDPAVATGQVIPSGSPVKVGAGANVVLVGASGRTVNLKGPFAGALTDSLSAAPDSGNLIEMIRALVGDQAPRSITGAVRGKPPSLWRDDTIGSLSDVFAIDVTTGGDTCVNSGSAAIDAVHDPAKPGPMNILATDGSVGAKLDWKPGVGRQPWPRSLPLREGDSYVFESVDAEDAAVAVIHVLPKTAPASDIAHVALLAEKGCTNQARLLLELVAKTTR